MFTRTTFMEKQIKKKCNKKCSDKKSTQMYMQVNSDRSSKFHAHPHRCALGLSCRPPSTGNYFHPHTVTRRGYPWGCNAFPHKTEPAACWFRALTLLLILSSTVTILLNALWWPHGHWSWSGHAGHSRKRQHSWSKCAHRENFYFLGFTSTSLEVLLGQLEWK